VSFLDEEAFDVYRTEVQEVRPSVDASSKAHGKQVQANENDPCEATHAARALRSM
jgi:hypothetical protein